MISEFQARNRSTIQDADGDYSDWIELRNTADSPLDLEGWHLTDDAENLRKWRFSSVSIPANSELLIFSSGKDRRDNSELHTNFRLSGSGEYLALVRPDGTIAQDFGPEYPPQVADQSYGVELHRKTTTVLLDGQDSLTAHVPADETLGLTWVDVSFDDSEWTSASGAVGFEHLRPASIEFDGFDSPLGEMWTVDAPDDGTSIVEVSDGALRIQVPADDALSTTDRGLAPIVHRDAPSASPTGTVPTDWEMVAHITKPKPSDRGGAGLAILDAATGRPALLLEQRVTSTFQFTDDRLSFGTWVNRIEGDYFLRILRDEIARSWTAYAKVNETDNWSLVGSVTDGVAGAPTVSDPRPAIYARGRSEGVTVHVESFEVRVAEQRPTYTPAISHDVGAAMSSQNGSIYLRIPFEWHAGNADVIDLGVQSDDGFTAYLNGVQIASLNAPQNLAWNSNATQPQASIPEQIPFQRFSIADAAELLNTGENVLSVHALNLASQDSDFFFQAMMTASELDALIAPRAYRQPTPGRPNQLPTALAPQVERPDGVFFGSRQVSLTTEANSHFEIRYTLDGSEVTRESTRYTEPFTITQSAMLQARTLDTLVLPNFQPSDLTSATFVALAEELRQESLRLPLLVLDTLRKSVPGTGSSDLARANTVLLQPNDDTGSDFITSATTNYLGRAGIRRRGNSTASQPKPSLVLETWGPSGTSDDDGFDVSLLQLPAENDWVLYAPYEFDRAMIRNQLGFELSRQMGQWAPRWQFVEVFLNDRGDSVTQDDYAGIYVLMEKIKQGTDRVDVSEIVRSAETEPAISGGYIWKIDRADPDARGFTAGDQALNWVYPKSPLSVTADEDQKATDQQQQWVTQHFDQFRATLDAPDINDSNGYSKYIDIDSWIDQHILNTLMWNVDAFTLSAYLHKDRNGKIVYGPLWDLDRSAESQDPRDDDPHLWKQFFTANWWRHLASDPGFWQRYVDRWSTLRKTVLSDQSVMALIDRLVSQISNESIERNFARWPEVAPRTAGSFFSGALDGTFAGEIGHLRTWMQQRLSFIDAQFARTPQLFVGGQQIAAEENIFVSNSQPINLTATLSRVEDETLVSGVPGETIARYHVPTDNGLGLSWVEPGFDDSEWLLGATGLGFDAGGDLTDLIQTEVDPRVHADATSILARIEFSVGDIQSYLTRQLILRISYDDGFVAYLNGVEIARDGIDALEIGWDTRAGTSRSDAAVRTLRELDVSRHRNLLLPGRNLLALRAINTTASSNDMLLLPELASRMVAFASSPTAEVYYTIDGTDPRAPDGSPAATARRVQDDTNLALIEDTQLIARTLDSANRGEEASVVRTDWSAPVRYNLMIRETPGDFNADGGVDGLDIDLLAAAIRDGSGVLAFDLTGDGIVGSEDQDELVRNILETDYGDANLDGVVDSADLVFAFKAGQYEDDLHENSTWATGDWDGDGEFTFSDLDLIQCLGQYQS